MKITYLTDYKQFNRDNLTIALGYFDGVHLGHKKVIEKAIRLSKETSTKSIVLTFSSSIKSFIFNTKEEHLTSINDKVEIFKKLGIDEVIFINLNDEFVKLSYMEFFDIFLRKAKNVVCGFDYTFGNLGKGNVSILKELLSDRVSVIPKLELNGIKVGAKEISSQIKAGNLELSERYLGHKYLIDGKLYKRNKYFALNTQDYVVPKNGYYIIEFMSNGSVKDIKAKIKLIDPSNGILLRETDNSVLENLFKESNKFRIHFKEIDK